MFIIINLNIGLLRQGYRIESRPEASGITNEHPFPESLHHPTPASTTATGS